MGLTWRADWSFTAPGEDPEGGVTLAPEDLDLACAGPGTPYDESLAPTAAGKACEAVFTQSSFRHLSSAGGVDLHGRLTGRCPTSRRSSGVRASSATPFQRHAAAAGASGRVRC